VPAKQSRFIPACQTANALAQQAVTLGKLMKKPFTKIASVVFGVVAAIHLCRLVFPFSLVVGGFMVPLWFNAIGALIAASLAVLLWRESQ
jgi:hypothetical protein